MKEKFILIERSKLVENMLSPYDNIKYDMGGLVKSISEKGLLNGICVCPIPDTDTFEIIDGIMRNRAYGILNRTHIEGYIKIVAENEKAAIIVELNRYREKTFYDKLEEGLMILKSLPSQPGKRNDLTGNATGKTRTQIAGDEVGVSASSLEKYQKIKVMDAKYPDKKIMVTFKKGEKSLSKLADEVTDVMVKKFKEFHELNGAKSAIQIPLPLPFETDNFGIYNKSCADMNRNDIPQHKRTVRKVGVTSFPYWQQATYNPDNPKELGHEETPEEFLEDLKPAMRNMYEMLEPGESFFVNMDDTYEWDKDNIIPELFVTMMTKEVGFHKHCTIIFQKKACTMKGHVRQRPNHSWEYIYWFVKDMATFKKDSGNFYNNIEFYDENKQVQFGRYGGRRNADGSKTKPKICVKKPYKRFMDFIDEQEFLDTIITSTAGGDNRMVKKIFGVEHPCPFATTVPLYPILYCTKPGDIVIDPFMGSVSTLITAILMGRFGIGYEIEPNFYKLSMDRILETLKNNTDPKMAQIIEAEFNRKWNNAA